VIGHQHRHSQPTSAAKAASSTIKVSTGIMMHPITGKCEPWFSFQILSQTAGNYFRILAAESDCGRGTESMLCLRSFAVPASNPWIEEE
jgi:hypothetical protein